ncbi:MAG: cytidine deaminase [Saprospiraceae bacterium]|nr:cytidine deaminase [Saprospiraceae bacterium]
MKKKIIKAEVEVFENEDELSRNNRELLAAAKDAASRAYAPYSKFQVGAALLLENGEIILGSNQENAAYPVTICAERTAIFAAATQFPDIPILKIAITIISPEANINRPVPPCGSCRQVIYETELRYSKNIEIFMQGDHGIIYKVKSIKDLLPLLFDASFL